MRCPHEWCGAPYSLQKWFDRHLELHKELHDGPASPQGCRGQGHRARTMNEVVKIFVVRRDAWTCRLCGKPVRERHWDYSGKRDILIEADYEIHHIIPVSEGGAHCMANLVTACLKCHRGGVRNRRYSTAKTSASLEDFP